MSANFMYSGSLYRVVSKIPGSVSDFTATDGEALDCVLAGWKPPPPRLQATNGDLVAVPGQQSRTDDRPCRSKVQAFGPADTLRWENTYMPLCRCPLKALNFSKQVILKQILFLVLYFISF